jgi:hypothetical protein
MNSQFQPRRRGFQTPTRKLFWRLWGQACKRHGWQNTREARHALYRRALGYDKDQNQFGHKEWDLVFKELRLNVQGLVSEGAERLGGVADAGERARKIHAIRQLQVEAYIIAVAEDKFGVHAYWENLELGQLEQLRITLIERKRAQERKQAREARQYKLDLARIEKELVAEKAMERHDDLPVPPDEEKKVSLPGGTITDDYYEQ